MSRKSDFDQVVVEGETVEEILAQEDTEQKISPHSPGWSEHVLDHLDES